MKNVPNILTVSRFFIAVAFIIFFQMDVAWAVFLATALFTIGALTDLLDGYLARKYQLFSDFGKMMDPIADKFLVLSAFFVFMQKGYIAGWMFWVIAAREILVTASRLLLLRKGKVIAAEGAGKLKTVLQMVTIFVMLIISVLLHSTSDPSSWVSQEGAMRCYFVITQMLMILTVTLTLYSGVMYFLNNRKNLT
jgi:CDP-diacylglycerol--glycerol-3-phosphate 3-phosphatidyltransferase